MEDLLHVCIVLKNFKLHDNIIIKCFSETLLYVIILKWGMLSAIPKVHNLHSRRSEGRGEGRQKREDGEGRIAGRGRGENACSDDVRFCISAHYQR